MDSDAGSRLCLVLDVDGGRATAVVALLSNLADFATDLDVALPAELTGLPFELLAEADVVGTGWQWQLAPPLARVPESVVDGVQRLPWLNDAGVLSLARGLPLSGPSDTRWAWKEQEVEELQVLTGDCVRTLLEMPALDFGFLAAGHLDRDAIQEMVLTASELASARSVALAGSTAEALGLEDLTMDDRLVAELGFDAGLAIHELLIASVQDDQPATATSIESLPHRRVDPDRDPLARLVAGSTSTVRVLTWSELWGDASGGVIEVDVHGRTRRIVRERIPHERV